MERVPDSTDRDAPLGAAVSEEAAGESPRLEDAAAVALSDPMADSANADPLSPAVRRLVRQYDLDVTGIHGTGPSGRIRVGDVIGLIGNRAETAPSAAAERPSRPSPSAQPVPRQDSARAETDDDFEPAAAHANPTSTIFECDLGRVLSHRKQQRLANVELLLTSYFVAACKQALLAVEEITAGRPACFGVELASAEGDTRSALVDTAELPATESWHDHLLAIDAELKANVGTDLATANLLVHHFGASGSLVATPTPIAHGHAASLGIGRVRREVVVRTVDGEDVPRVAPTCFLSLSFLPDRLALQRANLFMARLVHALEQWPS